MIAGISHVITAWKGLQGDDSDTMSFSINTRFPATSTLGNIMDIIKIKELLKSRENQLVAWLSRKALEEETK